MLIFLFIIVETNILKLVLIKNLEVEELFLQTILLLYNNSCLLNQLFLNYQMKKIKTKLIRQKIWERSYFKIIKIKMVRNLKLELKLTSNVEDVNSNHLLKSFLLKI